MQLRLSSSLPALLLIAWLLMPSHPLLAQEPVTIGVINFVGKVGVNQNEADVLTDVMAEKIGRMGEVRVITSEDLFAIVSSDRRKRLVECQDEMACVIEEVSGALGMEWMVSGNVSRVGDKYLLNLKLVDIRNANVAARVTRGIEGGYDRLLEEILEAVQDLFERAAGRLALVPTVSVASRRVQLLGESPSAVTVFTREDISSSGATNLVDILRRVPGFDVYCLKPAYPVLGARAQTHEFNNHVLLLVDGREALVELTGFALWRGLSFDLSEVTRVEVIRGPGSALYGANAFSAVVSVTTLPDRQTSGADLILSGGEQVSHRYFARLRISEQLGPGQLDASAGVGFESQGNPSALDDMALTANRFHAAARYRQTGLLDVSLHGGLTVGDNLIYVFLGDTFISNEYLPWLMAKADIEFSDSLKLKTQLYYNSLSGDIRLRASIRAYDIWIGNLPDVSWSSQTTDGQMQLEMQPVEGLLVSIGANLRYSLLSGQNFLLYDDDEVRGAAFTHLSWQPTIQGKSLPIQLTGGIRLDLNDLTGTVASPRLALVYRPVRNHSVRASFGMAFRKPSFFESRLHYQITEFNTATPEIVELAANSVSNADLDNERVTTFEIAWGGNFLDNTLRLSVDLFYNIYKDIIVFIPEVPFRLGLPDIAAADLEFTNDSPRVDALGGEIELVYRPGPDWNLWCNLGVRTALYEYDIDWEQDEPTLRINLGGRYHSKSGWIVDLALHYVSSYTLRLANIENLTHGAGRIPLGNRVLMIGRLGRQMEGPLGTDLEIGLQIRSPLGSPFREYGGVPMPLYLSRDNLADWGGEKLYRLVTFYLRGSY